MLDLSSFLNKYRRLVKDDSELKKVILEVLETKSIILKESDLTIKGQNLYLNCNPVVKNEIFIKKKEILDLINLKQERCRFRDIKF